MSSLGQSSSLAHFLVNMIIGIQSFIQQTSSDDKAIVPSEPAVLCQQTVTTCWDRVDLGIRGLPGGDY